MSILYGVEDLELGLAVGLEVTLDAGGGRGLVGSFVAGRGLGGGVPGLGRGIGVVGARAQRGGQEGGDGEAKGRGLHAGHPEPGPTTAVANRVPGDQDSEEYPS